MKSTISILILYLIFLFFGISSYSQGVWELQNPKPTSADLESVFCLPNSTTAWAVGANGNILKTVDGNTWSKVNSGTNSHLSGVYFFDANTGWAVGQNGTIIKTTNGGSSWTSQSSGTSLYLRTVHFININTGWAIASYYSPRRSVIVKTTNGGNTWTTTTLAGYQLYDIYFINSNIGWAVGWSGAILKSVDGGTNWIAQTSGTTRWFYQVLFTDVNTGWAIGEFGTIFKTTNGGTNWVAQTSGTSKNLSGSYFFNSNSGWIVGESGTILKTTNGGTNWVAQTSSTPNSLYGVRFSDANTGWAVGSGGTLIRSSDSGTNWTNLTQGTTMELRGVHFIDKNTGFAVGGLLAYYTSGIILKTTNGGITWTELLSGYAQGINSLDFIDANTGWAVGYNGAVLKTTDGGINWTTQVSGGQLRNVFFINSSTGWVVGDGGYISKTINGGTLWDQQSSGTTNSLNSSFFVDANTGWVVGILGTILKTTNGGATWTAQTSNTYFFLYGIYFINATTGWAVGEHGTILKTVNGGTTWTAQTSNYTELLYSICFTDANNGKAVGPYGIILKTSNGGLTWTTETSGISGHLNSVYLLDNKTGWAVGAGGTILHNTNYSPDIQAKNITFTNNTYQSINVSWTRGNGNQSALFARQTNSGNCIPDVNVTYLPNATFGLGDQIGSTGWYCAYNGSGTSAVLNGLQANTSYRFQVCEYNFSPDFTHYNISADTNNPVTATTAIAPPQITSNPTDQTLCESSSTTFSVAASGSSLNYKWQYSSGQGYLDITDGGPYSGSNTSTLSITPVPANFTGNMYHCVVTNTSGSIASSHAVLTVIPLPVMPETISGNQIVCLNSNYTFIVPVIQNASTYNWTFPSGFSGISTTNSIDLSTGVDAVAGNITVQGSNICGSGPIRSLAVDVKHLPVNASAITGLDKVCTGSINIGYATSQISDADYYIWSLPFGATGTSTINSIMVNYGSDPLTGQIKVKGHNMCGDGIESVLPVTVTTVPSAIGTISGSTNACRNQNAVQYSINPIPNATTYSWTLPSGVTGSNQTNYVSLNFGPDAVSGDLKVSGVNFCGTGAQILLPVTVNAVPDPVGAVSGPAIVCKGQTNVLYTVVKSEKATTYVWDLPDGTRETTVSNKITLNFGSASTSGNLIVTPYNSCGGGNSSSLYIEVSVPPSPTISAPDAIEFCSGDSVLLSVSSVANTSYQWLKDGGTTGSNSNTYYAKEAGSYTINITNSSGCTSSSINSVSVQINPVPATAAIELSGPAQFCAGGNVTLSIPALTGLKYKWSNEDGPIAGGDTSFYTATATGKYNLDISNAAGCSVKTPAVNISVKPMPGKPVITASDNYRQGDCMSETPVKLSILSVAGCTYQWYKNGISQTGATLSYYEGFHPAGDYTVESDLNGCKSVSDKLNLDYASGPEKPYIYAQGPTVWYLACSNTKAQDYKWYYNEKLIENAGKYYYVANRKMGSYQVSIGNEKGCFTRSDVVTIPTGATGIEQPDEFSGLVVYPNPSKGLFKIEFDNQQHGNLFISIFSLDGKELINFMLRKDQDYFITEIDLTQLPEGNYLIRIDLNKSSTVRKIVIE